MDFKYRKHVARCKREAWRAFSAAVGATTAVERAEADAELFARNEAVKDAQAVLEIRECR